MWYMEPIDQSLPSLSRSLRARSPVPDPPHPPGEGCQSPWSPSALPRVPACHALVPGEMREAPSPPGLVFPAPMRPHTQLTLGDQNPQASMQVPALQPKLFLEAFLGGGAQAAH